MIVSLNGAWRGEGFSPDGKRVSFAGHVPGCVHGDLMRQGMLEDPFWRDNAAKSRWIETWNWAYEREFQAEEAWTNALIEFDGLDTYCQVFLNGVEIGRSDDMFVPCAFPAKGLKQGANQLRVVFFSPIARTSGLPERSAAFTWERVYTRRLQCTYSWDWVDRFVTMGIFRDVRLHRVENREVADLHAETRVIDDFGAQLFCHVDFRGEGENAFCSLTLEAPDGQVAYAKRRRIVEDGISEIIDVEKPCLWWPNGYGEQPLYKLTVRVEENGRCLDEKSIHVGIRTARILQKRDMPGTEFYEKCKKLQRGPHVSGKNAFWDRNQPEEFAGFALIVNGVPVFCKGANWVPCEPFPSEETPEKICALLKLAKDANANMIRVWGGGLFEQDAFYDACDRLGLMVTQDFLMACGSYPEWDDDFLAHLRREAETAATRLRSHACLVWWTGDNENGMNGDEDMPDYGGRRSALRAIGPVLERMDPNRPFLPSSPYGGRPYGSITRGTTHNTNYIGEWFSYIRFHDMKDYREYFDCYLSRFCAEEPVMGMPAVSSLERFMTRQDIFGGDESMHRFHTKNNPSEVFREFQIYDYMCAIAEKLLGEERCPEDRIMKRQYVQYEWIRITMELYRREKWFSSGMIYWMLNDCWPASGWSIVDYYGCPKAAWYGFRRAAQPVIASIDCKDGRYRLHVCCDGPVPRQGQARLFVQSFDRPEPLEERRVSFRVAANESACVLEAELPKADAGALLMAEIQGDGFADRAWFFEGRPQDCDFPGEPPEIVSVTDDAVVLRAKKYVHAVALDGGCGFQDNYFSMLPSEEKSVPFLRRRDGRITMRVLNSNQETIVIEK